jgi:hypothetical protein
MFLENLSKLLPHYTWCHNQKLILFIVTAVRISNPKYEKFTPQNECIQYSMLSSLWNNMSGQILEISEYGLQNFFWDWTDVFLNSSFSCQLCEELHSVHCFWDVTIENTRGFTVNQRIKMVEQHFHHKHPVTCVRGFYKLLFIQSARYFLKGMTDWAYKETACNCTTTMCIFAPD